MSQECCILTESDCVLLGSCKNGNKLLKTFRGGRYIGQLGNWEFQNKSFEMGQNNGLSHSSTCTCVNVFMSVLQRDPNASYLPISSVQTCSEISQTHVKWLNVKNDLFIRKVKSGISLICQLFPKNSLSRLLCSWENAILTSLL